MAAIVKMRNKATGVIVGVREEKAGKLGIQWVPVSGKATPEKASAKTTGAPTTKAEWAALAAELGVEVDPKAKRDEIRAAVKEFQAAAAEDGAANESDGDDA